MQSSSLVFSVLMLFFQTTAVTVLDPVLEPWERDPWYWSYENKPVLLLGASDDDNLFQWHEEALLAQLDKLAAAGGNVIRNTMSDRKDKGFEIYPFKMLSNGKYDLNIWNDEYWLRLERLLRETSRRRIFVQIEIWDRFDYSDLDDTNRWQIHPYNPQNNVNYTVTESGLNTRYPDHPGANTQPFFFTTPEQKDNHCVLYYQQRFVNQLMEVSLPYSHVLYCMNNETSGEEEWSNYWALFVKSLADRKKRKVYLTEMWDEWDLTAAQHRQTFDHPDLFGFVDVSQNNHNVGDEHWDNFLHVRNRLAIQPRPMNTTKTYGASGNKFGHTDQDAIERFWRHLLAGAASIRFHRPPSGLGLSGRAIRCIRAARTLETMVPIWTLKAANELLSDRDSNEAYLAASGGSAYVVYFPAGGRVGLDVSGSKGPFTLNWINIDTGQSRDQELVVDRDEITLSPPSKDNWVVAVVQPVRQQIK